MEHVQQFRQNIAFVGRRNQGEWSFNMMLDCCWSIIGYELKTNYKRKS
jgi:hypothetical protein